MKKLNDAFDEFMIDPGPERGPLLSVCGAKRYVTNALSGAAARIYHHR